MVEYIAQCKRDALEITDRIMTLEQEREQCTQNTSTFAELSFRITELHISRSNLLYAIQEMEDRSHAAETTKTM